MNQEGMNKEGLTIQWLCQALYPRIAIGSTDSRERRRIIASVSNRMLTREELFDLRNTVINQSMDKFNLMELFTGLELEENERQAMIRFMRAVIADETEKHKPT